MQIKEGVTRENFPKLLVEKRYVRGAEIGVQGGDHAVHILNHWTGSLLLVDPWKYYDGLRYNDMANTTDANHNIHLANCKRKLVPFTGRFEIKRMFSHEAAVEVPNGSLDFAYFDGNHTYAWVWLDQMIWYDKIRSGGMISGHDFVVDGEPPLGNIYGVKYAVRDFVEARGIKELFVSVEEWPIWYFFKP